MAPVQGTLGYRQAGERSFAGLRRKLGDMTGGNQKPKEGQTSMGGPHPEAVPVVNKCRAILADLHAHKHLCELTKLRGVWPVSEGP